MPFDTTSSSGRLQAAAGTPGRATLLTALSQKRNALNFVRLLLATSVIFGHAWSVGGFSQTEFTWVGEWAVCGFFAISGFLIAGSRMRLPLGTFLLHRTLRIYPAFLACLAVVAFVLAPLSTLLTGESYNLASGAAYVWKNFTLYVLQYGIDSTLVSVPFPGTWNAPLWTLKYEFAAYVLAAILLSIGLLRRRPFATALTLFAVVAAANFLASDVLHVTSDLVLNATKLGSFFLAGMVIYFAAGRISLSWKLFALAVAVLVGLIALGWQQQLGQLPFAFAVLWLGAVLPIRIGVKNDISYGIYIWAWPVQQYLAIIDTSAIGPWLSALLAVGITTPLAWASWKLIEQPSMGLKRLFDKRTTPAQA